MHTSHQVALQTKHESLDRRIVEERGRPHPDAALLADLKKRKLRVKEEIASL